MRKSASGVAAIHFKRLRAEVASLSPRRAAHCAIAVMLLMGCVDSAVTVPRHLPTRKLEESSPAEWPVAALRARGVVACTGVLVAPTVLLSARHCVGVESATFVGGLGASLRIVGHDAPPNAGIDAALLYLERPVDVPPVPLRAASETSPPREVSIVGFGRDVSGRAGALRILSVRMRGWGCDSESASARGCAPGLELVLPRMGGLDTCQGDSGGPVLDRSTDGTLRLVAITSRAVRDSILVCGDGGIYVRADAIVGWVTRAIRRQAKLGERLSKR